MKIILSLLSLLAVACNGQQGNYRLKGRIGNLDAPATCYLVIGNRCDSVVLSRGRLEFTGTIEEPVRVTLVLNYAGTGLKKAPQMREFYIEPGVTTLHSPDSLSNMVFVDSPINDQLEAYESSIGGSVYQISSEFGRRHMATPIEQREDTAFLNAYGRAFLAAMDARTRAQVDYARANPSSFFSVVALSEAADSKVPLEQIGPLLAALDESVRNCATGRALAGRIDSFNATCVGRPAPQFTLPAPDGRMISLSDYRGRYLLIDFWASWCGPCRAENPNVAKAYALYKERGFEVLAVSLDDDRGEWVQAIEKDGLRWTNVSDLEGLKSGVAQQYDIRSIPRNLLIDPQGVIVAKDLRGEALQACLAEIFPD